jgi:hypothetical protein
MAIILRNKNIAIPNTDNTLSTTNGVVSVNCANLISTDTGNQLSLGSDNKIKGLTLGSDNKLKGTTGKLTVGSDGKLMMAQAMQDDKIEIYRNDTGAMMASGNLGDNITLDFTGCELATTYTILTCNTTRYKDRTTITCHNNVSHGSYTFYIEDMCQYNYSGGSNGLFINTLPANSNNVTDVTIYACGKKGIGSTINLQGAGSLLFIHTLHIYVNREYIDMLNFINETQQKIINPMVSITTIEHAPVNPYV